MGTGADEAFDLKHGEQRDITRPSHGSLQIQISLPSGREVGGRVGGGGGGRENWRVEKGVGYG